MYRVGPWFAPACRPIVGIMKDIARRTSIAAALAIATVALGAPAASANQPAREIVPAPDDIVITGQCAFPVLGHIDGDEIDTTFTDKADNTVKLMGVFPGNTLTLTNLDTGKSITLVATGQFHAQLKRDGSGVVRVTGHGPFISHPITGEPGIWYMSGRLIATLDTDGNPMSLNSTGKLVNLCAQLAA
jgi:hypothetical protein